MTPEATLLARIVANNDARKLLEILLAHEGIALGGEILTIGQAELDLLAELKPAKPDVVYNLAAMTFDPNSEQLTAIDGAFFWWGQTPEGLSYWDNQDDNLTQEGRDKIAAMRKQFEREGR